MTNLKTARVLVFCATFVLSVGCIPGGDGDGDSNNGVIQDTGSTEDTGASDAGGDSSSSDTGAEPDTSEGMDTGGGGGLQGLEGYCAYYFECGGSYYEDVDDCVSQSVNYWGECRRDELDTFGDCMLGLSCEEWGNPDAYNPSNTSCSDEWSAISESPSC